MGEGHYGNDYLICKQNQPGFVSRIDNPDGSVTITKIIDGHDSRLANISLGLKATPEGYTWHHLENGTHMILVRTEIHSVRYGGFSHMGGSSIIRNR